MKSRRGGIPYFPQAGYSDCGPAVLRMVLASRGIDVSLEQLRAEMGSGRNGASASILLRVARRYGLNGRGVRCDLPGLGELEPGAILFWRLNHYVVLERVTKSHLVIVDPAMGRRRVALSRARDEFSGIALEFASSDDPLPRRRRWLGVREWGVIAQFLPRTRKWALAFVVSGLLLVFNLAFPLTLGWLVGEGPNAETPVGGPILLALLAAATLVYGVLQLARLRLLLAIQGRIESRIAHVTMAHLMRLPIGFFTTRHPGDLTQQLRTAGHVRQAISVTTLGAGFDALLVLGLTAVVAYREIWLGLVVAACTVVFLAGVGVSWSRQRYLAVDASGAQLKAVDQVHEIFATMGSVKALGAERRVSAGWARSFAAELDTGARRRWAAGSVAAFVSTLQFGAPLGVVLVGLVSAGGQSSPATAVVLAVACVGLFLSLSNLSAAATTLVDLYPQLIRLKDILATPAEPVGSVRAARLERPPAIRFDAVSFTYPGATEDAVHGVQVSVAAGSTMAVIGPSGAGKSTIAMLLAGLLTPTSGQILIDDQNLAELDSAEFRSCIGYVDQDSSLMAGSILDNIRLGCAQASLDDVRAAARMAQIDEFIWALPMKYETMIGAGGAGISGGQRQRIALARVLIKKPPLLILDEATSAVDPDTEDEIFRQVGDLGVTVVVLGHRATKGANSILEITPGGSRMLDTQQLTNGRKSM